MAKRTRAFDLSAVVEAVSAPEEIPEEWDLETVTAEILTMKQDAGNAILGIGQRLIEVKARLPHGEWLPWLEDRVEFSERTARNFMRLAREWTNRQALADLGAAKALLLLALPAEERNQFMEEIHMVKGEEKAVIDMTTRELEKAIRERDAARKTAEQAQADVKVTEESLAKITEDLKLFRESLERATSEKEQAVARSASLETELAALRAKPVDVAVMAVDQEKLDATRAEAVAEMQVEVDEAKAAAAKAEEKRKSAEAALAEANAKLEAAWKAEKRALIRADRELSQFELLFGQVQETVSKLRSLLLEVRSREEPGAAEKLVHALLLLSDKVKEAAQ